MAKLTHKFFQQPTLNMAQELLGCRFVHKRGNELISGFIVETEAYLPREDPACHSARGETPRNRVMFGPAGCLYIYSIHNRYCVNIVSETTGIGAAVLIRALEPIVGLASMSLLRPVSKPHELTNGPGKLCQAFGLDLRFNGENLIQGKNLWLESKPNSVEFAIRRTTRIGISQGKDLPYRFFVDGNPFVSGLAMDHSITRDRYLGSIYQRVQSQ